MASGSFEFAIVGNNKLQGKIDWWSSSNGAVANTSNVSAILYAKRPDGFGPTKGSSWSGFVKIGTSQQDVQTAYRELDTEWVEMARKENVVISHTDSGTGSVEISGSVSGPSGTSLSGLTSSGSSTVTLDRINRYFTQTPTITLTSKTETTFMLTWNTSETCSKVVLNVGGSSYSTTNVNSKTGSLTISNRNANTSYAVKGTFTRSDSGLTSDSATSTWTTYQYPYITGISKNNLLIGDEQAVSIYNPIGRYIHVYMKKSNTSGTLLHDLTTNLGYVPFTPTANTLYSSIPTASSATAVYYCTYDNHMVSSKSGTYSVRGTETPTFSNFTFADTNATTTALTGNSSIIVKGYSNVQMDVSVANKATAKNSATMSSYKMQVEGMNAITRDYSSSAVVSATQNGATSNNVSVTAIDSRGLATTITKSGTLKDYFKPYVTSLTATRDDNGVGTTVTLSYEINFWNQSFGSVNNSVVNLAYQYKTSYGSWVDGDTTLTYTLSGNKLTGSVSIRGDIGADGFTLGETFDIKLTLQDRLSTITNTTTLLSGTPAIAIAGNKVGIGMPVKTSLSAQLQVKGNLALLGGELEGTATSAKEIENYYTSRPTSANVTADGSGGLKTFKATSAMTTGKPPGDSHIIHMSWDNTTGYDSQIAVRNNGDEVKMWIRSQTAGTWGNWTELINANEYNLLGSYTTVSGSYTTKAWSAGTATNCTWAAPRDGKYIITMFFQANPDAGAYVYKQLQAQGTATRPLGNMLFFSGGPSSGGTSEKSVIATMHSFPITATTGQTIYPYIHTPQANQVWTVKITGMYVGR